jgi:Glycosyl transferase family 2
MSHVPPPEPQSWIRYFYRIVAAEVSTITRFYDRVVQVAAPSSDRGLLLENVASPLKERAAGVGDMPDCSGEVDRRTAVLVNGNFNLGTDIQDFLARLRPRLSRSSRVVVIGYNPYFKGLFRLLSKLGLARAEPPDTFVTQESLKQLARISGFEVVRIRPVGYFPFRLLGLGSLINRVMPLLPVVRWLSFSSVIVLRPVIASAVKPSLTIVIPARNEAGNIENALLQTPQLEGVKTEIIFVEGNSTDDTWDRIQQVVNRGHPFFQLSAYKQPGRGKNDAVRHGFAHARHDLWCILDADLTMPPEMLPRFYQAYVDGHADFINGSRLFYPMEGEAMKFLNLLGNIFFAKALSVVLGMRIGDSLCGTKLVARHDYARIVRWRERFGDFDPFGDFELLFPAAELALGCVDIPVAYKARTYGTTNIHRFRHGLILLKMTLIGLWRVAAGHTR